MNWLNTIDEKEEIINLFMDYETFGEHQWAETGIFDFMKALPARVFSDPNLNFSPAEAAQSISPLRQCMCLTPYRADEERDLTAWLGNEMQEEAFNNLYKIADTVYQLDDPALLRDWKLLQTSDHFYYMCTKWFSDGDVHKYFNPYDTPYEAFINYMNALSDFTLRVKSAYQKQQATEGILGPEDLDAAIKDYEDKLKQLKALKKKRG